MCVRCCFSPFDLCSFSARVTDRNSNILNTAIIPLLSDDEIFVLMCVMLFVSNAGWLCTLYSTIFGNLEHCLKKNYVNYYYYYYYYYHYYYYCYYIILKNIPIVLLPKSNRMTFVPMFVFRLWEVNISSLGGLQLTWLRFCRLSLCVKVDAENAHSRISLQSSLNFTFSVTATIFFVSFEDLQS